jgi:hypothetical protein
VWGYCISCLAGYTQFGFYLPQSEAGTVVGVGRWAGEPLASKEVTLIAHQIWEAAPDLTTIETATETTAEEEALAALAETESVAEALGTRKSTRIASTMSPEACNKSDPN